MRSKLLPIHRPRFSVARLMVLIAMVALVLAGARWINEIVERRSKALKHEHQVKCYKEMTGCVDEPDVVLQIIPYEPRDPSDPAYRQPARFSRFILYRAIPPHGDAREEFVRRHRDEILTMCREQVEFHEQMRRKWSRAAWFPWQPVEPDGLGPPSDGGVEVAPSSGSSGNY